MTITSFNLGRRGENIAADYLLDHRFRIIERNFRSKFGEIDIIAQKADKIFFVEVKTRSNLDKGKPYEAITPRKASQMKKAATYFLLQNDYKKCKHAISVISILLNGASCVDFKFYENIYWG